MKNDNHPLIRALKAKSGANDRPHIEMPDIPRNFELRTKELPGLSKVKPGDSLSISLDGHVSSTHDDGRVIMAVHKVSDDSETQEELDKPIQVSTQESHTG